MHLRAWDPPAGEWASAYGYDKLDSRYLEYALESREVQAEIWNSVKQAAQPCLYLNGMSKLRIPLLPLSEQLHIVAQLNALRTEVDGLRKLQSDTASELEALLPAILDRAFKGDF